MSFNVPWPADYGGVIDVYYRIKALAALGVKIHLHCYTYGRKPAKELEPLCESVHYYKRETYPWHLLVRRPYIVSSRCSKELLRNLKKDSYPILLEGLHNGFVMEQLTDRTVMMRAHNIEHEYYGRLAKSASNALRRLYLNMDARKLRRYEPVMKKASAVLAITDNDAHHFEELGCRNVLTIPAFHPQDEVSIQEGRGDYALYQGDLSVPDNIEAALFLMREVFNHSEHRLIIAGRNPQPQVLKEKQNHANVTLESDVSSERMEQLIREAQVNIMVTRQETGVKLKLLHALYLGRHCLVNSSMVANSHLEQACVIADSAAGMRSQLDRLMNQEFNRESIEKRKVQLGMRYSNLENAKKIVAHLLNLEENEL